VEEGKGEVEGVEEGEGGRALQKKKKGLTWGCVNSWLLRNRPLFLFLPTNEEVLLCHVTSGIQ
jgi:hypothetical protein